MRADDIWSISDFDSVYISGWLITVAGFLLYLFSWNYIRRRFFEFFLKSHWLMFCLAGGASFVHGATATSAGFVIFMVTYVVRLLFFDKRRVAHVTVLPRNVIRLTVPRGDMKFLAGQFCFICVPSLARTQYHPYTISSAPHDTTVDFHIRALGDWTDKLLTWAKTTPQAEIRIDGPLGLVALDIEGPKYQHFVFVAG